MFSGWVNSVTSTNPALFTMLNTIILQKPRSDGQRVRRSFSV